MKNAIMNGVNIISYAYIYIGGRDGGVKLFPGGGVQMLISLETHVRTCYFPGWVVRTPYPPLDPYMRNVIITGQYLPQSRF